MNSANSWFKEIIFVSVFSRLAIVSLLKHGIYGNGQIIWLKIRIKEMQAA
jgi:hypothetical protein